MSVTFNRAALARAAKAALDEDAKVRIAYIKACDKYRAGHATNWNKRGQLKSVRDHLTKVLAKPAPITLGEVRKAAGIGLGSLDDLFYRPASDYEVERNVEKPKGLLSSAQILEIRALQAVLEAATGDTISANELKLLGLKNLAPVFAAASGQPGVSL